MGFVGKPDGKRQPRRPTHIWQNNIKVNLQNRECEGADWIHLAQVRGRMAVCENGDEQSGFKKEQENVFSVRGKISLSAKPLINVISYGDIIQIFTNFQIGLNDKHHYDSHMNYCAAAVTHREMWANTATSHNQDI